MYSSLSTCSIGLIFRPYGADGSVYEFLMNIVVTSRTVPPLSLSPAHMNALWSVLDNLSITKAFSLTV